MNTGGLICNCRCHNLDERRTDVCYLIREDLHCTLQRKKEQYENKKKRNKKQNEFSKIDEIILLIMETKRKQSIFVDT